MAQYWPSLVLLSLCLLSSSAWAYPWYFAGPLGQEGCARHPENTSEICSEPNPDVNCTGVFRAPHKVINTTSDSITFTVNTTDGCLVQPAQLCAGAKYKVTVNFPSPNGHYLLTSTYGAFDKVCLDKVGDFKTSCANRTCPMTSAKLSDTHTITMPADVTGDNVFRVSWVEGQMINMYGSRATYTFAPAASCIKACPGGPPTPPKVSIVANDVNDLSVTRGGIGADAETTLTVTVTGAPLPSTRVNFSTAPKDLLACSPKGATLTRVDGTLTATVVCRAAAGTKTGKARVRAVLARSIPAVVGWSQSITVK